jgi:hypothetical protein
MTEAASLVLPVDPTLHKLQLKAEEYRARAREAVAAAESATLDRVRDQRQAAAASWADLADVEEARFEDRRIRLSQGAK